MSWTPNGPTWRKLPRGELKLPYAVFLTDKIDDDGGTDAIVVAAAMATGSLSCTNHPASSGCHGASCSKIDETTSSEADFFANECIDPDGMAKPRWVV